MGKAPKEPDVSYRQSVKANLQVSEIDRAIRLHINRLATNGLLPAVKADHQVFLHYIVADDEGGLIGVEAEYTPEDHPHDR